MKGVIIQCKLNAPGSRHDSRVARQIYEKLQTATPDGYYLIMDTAFPCGIDQIHNGGCMACKGHLDIFGYFLTSIMMTSEAIYLKHVFDFTINCVWRTEKERWGINVSSTEWGELDNDRVYMQAAIKMAWAADMFVPGQQQQVTVLHEHQKWKMAQLGSSWQYGNGDVDMGVKLAMLKIVRQTQWMHLNLHIEFLYEDIDHDSDPGLMLDHGPEMLDLEFKLVSTALCEVAVMFNLGELVVEVINDSLSITKLIRKG
ncbi:hypothetical protein BDR03DRAFT_983046 [Suillus americanus]|nr:hypothetical protein BDR03DRAFT_983046 [Suillus americanus]